MYNVFIFLAFCFVQPASFTASSPHTPSFTHLLPSSSSSSHPTTLPHQSGEKDLSIGTYFGQRSYKLGALQTSGAAPSERVSPPVMYCLGYGWVGYFTQIKEGEAFSMLYLSYFFLISFKLVCYAHVFPCIS